MDDPMGTRRRKRDRLTLLRDLLLALSEESRPMRPTSTMYAMRVSWTTFKACLLAAVEAGLVKKVDKEASGRAGFLLELTEEGRESLRRLNAILIKINGTIK